MMYRQFETITWTPPACYKTVIEKSELAELLTCIFSHSYPSFHKGIIFSHSYPSFHKGIKLLN